MHVSLDFYARVTSIADSTGLLTGLGVTFGTLVTGRITWESALVDSDPSPNNDNYLPPNNPFVFDYAIHAGGLTISSTVQQNNFISVTRTIAAVTWHFEDGSPASNAGYVDDVGITLQSSWPNVVPLGNTLLQSFDPTLWDDGSVVVVGPPSSAANGWELRATLTHTERVEGHKSTPRKHHGRRARPKSK